eukprot:CAMPEP_0197660950 /NCGR_PEP_ID=MMETSP1338-20131121/51161_1 /TAXON_ID=43686 ORGANISM="Pelagodinium beii, Strain RCC1491" /NCGR_SAMPLE_ID=MMETSP1338 /ASSEMBLY_ACC=CAM_ASM_000754 /LENGTH=256 /DNA_ID=CAMNT_0043238413 /DNA_START=47 /DNA_END=817 /DNA_ORIENTATION=-
MIDPRYVFVPFNDFIGSQKGVEEAVTVLKFRRQVEHFGMVQRVTELPDGWLIRYSCEEEASTARKALRPPDSSTILKEASYPPPGLVCTPSASSSEELASLASSDTKSSKARSKKSSALLPCTANTFDSLQVNWEKLLKGEEHRTVLQLRGLPRRICENGQLEEFLQSNDLLDSVSRVRILQGKANSRFSSAELHAKSASAVLKLAKLFHGRQFLRSTLPVSVRFAHPELEVEEKSAPGLEPPPGLECLFQGSRLR